MKSGQPSLHSISITLLAGSATIGSLLGLSTQSPVVFWISIAVILTIGVPHGGLDHLTGRDLLSSRFGSLWKFLFFGGYLAVAFIVAGGWLTFPLLTAIGFFLISAWHFGLEEERAACSNLLWNHVQAVAMGGAVIWFPVLFQTDRMTEILQAVVPAGLVSTAWIIDLTKVIAWGLLPMIILSMMQDGLSRQWLRFVRNASFFLLFCVSDPLLSFVVYFCGWHSPRSLSGLASTYQKSIARVMLAAAPLTLGAIFSSLIGMLFWSNGQTLSDASVRTLFISLSAVAVPHLLLHGPVSGVLSRRSPSPLRPVEGF